jgi:hypothetical protein
MLLEPLYFSLTLLTPTTHSSPKPPKSLKISLPLSIGERYYPVR